MANSTRIFHFSCHCFVRPRSHRRSDIARQNESEELATCICLPRYLNFCSASSLAGELNHSVQRRQKWKPSSLDVIISRVAKPCSQKLQYMCRLTWCISSGCSLSSRAIFNGFLQPRTSGRECALEETKWALNWDISGFRCFLGNNGKRKTKCIIS